MGAVRTAYVQVLGVACAQLEVAPPKTGPHWHTPLAEIYRVEAQLRERGPGRPAGEPGPDPGSLTFPPPGQRCGPAAASNFDIPLFSDARGEGGQGVMRILVAAVAAVLAVTGCASATGNAGPGSTGAGRRCRYQPGDRRRSGSGPAGPSTSPSMKPVVAQCPVQLDEGQANNRKGARPVPGQIQVDWVLRCSVAPRAGGTRYLQVERSDSDPSALLAALRAPDEPRSKGACPAIAMVVPYFALIERDGTTLVPRLPDDRLPAAAGRGGAGAQRPAVHRDQPAPDALRRCPARPTASRCA